MQAHQYSEYPHDKINAASKVRIGQLMEGLPKNVELTMGAITQFMIIGDPEMTKGDDEKTQKFINDVNHHFRQAYAEKKGIDVNTLPELKGENLTVEEQKLLNEIPHVAVTFVGGLGTVKDGLGNFPIKALTFALHTPTTNPQTLSETLPATVAALESYLQTTEFATKYNLESKPIKNTAELRLENTFPFTLPDDEEKKVYKEEDASHHTYGNTTKLKMYIRDKDTGHSLLLQRNGDGQIVNGGEASNLAHALSSEMAKTLAQLQLVSFGTNEANYEMLKDADTCVGDQALSTEARDDQERTGTAYTHGKFGRNVGLATFIRPYHNTEDFEKSIVTGEVFSQNRTDENTNLASNYFPARASLHPAAPIAVMVAIAASEIEKAKQPGYQGMTLEQAAAAQTDICRTPQVALERFAENKKLADKYLGFVATGIVSSYVTQALPEQGKVKTIGM